MNRMIEVIGVPFALGGRIQGSAGGPDALMTYGLLSCLHSLGYQTNYCNLEQKSSFPEIFVPTPELRGKIYSERRVYEVAKLAGAKVFACHRVGNFPLVIGGDHSISLGTLPQFLEPSVRGERKVGLLWIDAHYDAHTELTTASHFANGLPLAYALGSGETMLGCYGGDVHDTLQKKRLSFDPHLVLHIGAGESDCEPEERALLELHNVRTVSMKDIHDNGEAMFIRPLLQLLDQIDELVVTFDLDAMKKDFAPAVSFQSKNGMNPHQAFLIADMVRKSTKLRQLEIMEYNPDFEIYENGNPVTAVFVKNLLAHMFEHI